MELEGVSLDEFGKGEEKRPDSVIPAASNKEGGSAQGNDRTGRLNLNRRLSERQAKGMVGPGSSQGRPRQRA